MNPPRVTKAAPDFRFLTPEELEALPDEKRTAYLKLAIREITSKMNKVLAKNASTSRKVN